ncbi:hypothetical protein BJ322DRAFT_1066702 [Thelephora terrestris]|uniref:Uncharacterized protein n=1 Tax=Thelephora terrestris TaxID=56493 RepID=A0A9P6HC04_9AGAM|nr:hypothetical protein BJ322DRAFT_1066702 [Thelephora terrestris]
MIRPAYSGNRRSLVLAFDIGTTFSGVSYVLLDPGQVPKINNVTRFPGQLLETYSKIPSTIWYDSSGKACSFGAESTLLQTVDRAEAEGWTRLDWWKLNLAPTALCKKLPAGYAPALPHGLTIVEVFADFMHYLFACAETYFKESHAFGESVWDSVKEDITFILSHPNGWGGIEQVTMRRAAVKAELIPDTSEGHDRIQFVTEGEASFNFCANNGISGDAIKVGRNVIVIDAGGGTIDISGYTVENQNPPQVAEIFASECRLLGATTVTRRAREFIKDRLKNSRFDSEDIVSHITQCFDETTKRLFKSSDDINYIQFGSPFETEPSLGIQRGKMKLSGTEVAAFFEESIKGMIHAIESHLDSFKADDSTVLLVGGFGESPWLFQRLRSRLECLGLSLSRTDVPTNKAVAQGAIAFYLDGIVKSRVSRYKYGVLTNVRYNPYDPQHAERWSQAVFMADGVKRLPGAFSTILDESVRVSETEEFRKAFRHFSRSRQSLDRIDDTIKAYKGSSQDPPWIDSEPASFFNLCTVSADTSRVPKPKITNPRGSHYEVYYEVALLFGLTELKAQLVWTENGVEKRGQAEIVYDETQGCAEM